MLRLLTKPCYTIAGRRVQIDDRFRARNGDVYQIVRFDHSDRRYPIYAHNGTQSAWFTGDGRHYEDSESDRDLIKYLETTC